MSSTNVHSKDLYCAGAQITPTENELEIPPRNAKRGPKTFDIRNGEGIDIPVGNSELNKNGQLKEQGTNAIITMFNPQAYKVLASKQQKVKKATMSKDEGRGE